MADEPKKEEKPGAAGAGEPKGPEAAKDAAGGAGAASPEQAKAAAGAPGAPKGEPRKLPAFAKPVKKAGKVDSEVKRRLGERRKPPAEEIVTKRGGGLGWDKILALAMPIVLLCGGGGAYWYYQKARPSRELAAWYSAFREATRNKDVKALLNLHSVEGRRELENSFCLLKIGENLGEEAMQEAAMGPKRRIVESDQPEFEEYCKKLMEAGKLGLDVEPQGFVVSEEELYGTVQIPGPDVVATRQDKRLPWGFTERMKSYEPGKVPKPEPPAGGKGGAAGGGD